MQPMSRKDLAFQDWQDLEDLRPFAEGLLKIAKAKRFNTDKATSRNEDFVQAIEDALLCIPPSAEYLEGDL